MRRVMMVALLLVGLQSMGAQEKAAPALPTAEMQRLAKLFDGTWDYTETYTKGGQGSGVYTSEMGPGGNSLVHRFHSRGEMGDFEGLIVMTWDPAEKAYKSYGFGNDYSGVILQTGQWEDDVLVYRGEFTMGKSRIAFRLTTKLVAPGKMVREQYTAVNGGAEKLFLRVEATKRP